MQGLVYLHSLWKTQNHLFLFYPTWLSCKGDILNQWQWVIVLLNSRSNCNDSSQCIITIIKGLIMILVFILHLLSFKLFYIPPSLHPETYKKSEMILPIGRNSTVPYPSSSRLHNCLSAWSLFSKQPSSLPKWRHYAAQTGWVEDIYALDSFII